MSGKVRRARRHTVPVDVALLCLVEIAHVENSCQQGEGVVRTGDHVRQRPKKQELPVTAKKFHPCCGWLL